MNFWPFRSIIQGRSTEQWRIGRLQENKVIASLRTNSAMLYELTRVKEESYSFLLIFSITSLASHFTCMICLLIMILWIIINKILWLKVIFIEQYSPRSNNIMKYAEFQAVAQARLFYISSPKITTAVWTLVFNIFLSLEELR